MIMFGSVRLIKIVKLSRYLLCCLLVILPTLSERRKLFYKNVNLDDADHLHLLPRLLPAAHAGQRHRRRGRFACLCMSKKCCHF